MYIAQNGPNDVINIIAADDFSVGSWRIFNPNEWTRAESRDIIQSCVAEYSLLAFTVAKLRALFDSARELCWRRYVQIRESLGQPLQYPGKCAYWAEVPEVHLHIEAFLGSAKTFLDIVVQLAATEGIVTSAVDGFHRKGGNIGGKFLNCLRCNACNSHKDRASQL